MTYDVAVVTPTIIRPQLDKAVRSVFNQDFDGRIQMLVGLDYPCGNKEDLWALQIQAPNHIQLDVLHLGYSTRADKGGLYYSYGGGALRSILTLAANARYVAYLDDDCWFESNHISSLMDLITSRELDWVYSKRRPFYTETGKPVPHENIGELPEIDTNCFLIDKLSCHDAILGWTSVVKKEPWDDVEPFKQALQRGRDKRYAGTGMETTCYGLTPESPSYNLHHK